MPLNSFSVSTMASNSCLVTLYFCCAVLSFLLKKRQLPAVLSNDSSLLILGTDSIDLKSLWVVWVGHENIFGNGCLYVVESCLMNSILMPQLLFSFVGLCDFGMCTLSNQVSEWGQHFTTSCPEVSVVLDNAQESLELLNILRWC